MQPSVQTCGAIANGSKNGAGSAWGYCIRCRKTIALNPQAPYCYNCYDVWKRYKNRTCEERHCHVRGKSHPSTMVKPACYDCYKEHRKTLSFPAC